MSTAIEELAQKFVEKHKITFKHGKRETFFSDVKKSLQPAGNKFRTPQGAQVADPESYMSAMIETALYSTNRPSVEATYVSPYPIRSESQRGANKKLSETVLKKALEHENIVFSQGMEKTVIDLISSHFVPADDQDGIVFHKINDTPVGSFFAKQGYKLEDMLNVAGVSHLIDGPATKISKMQHRAQLRTMAASMAEPGAKAPTIDKLADELAQFERRNLKTGKKIPYQNHNGIEQEFVKMREMHGDDRHALLAGSRSFMNSLEDVSSVKLEASKIKIADESSDYSFND